MALANTDAILAMSTTGRTAQVIDVRDLATFAIRERGTGILNAVGHSVPLADAFDRAAFVSGYAGERIPADDEWLRAHDVGYWAGPRSLPLWLPPEDAAMTTRSNAAYLARGGTIRDLDETLRDVLADERERGLDRERRAGLRRTEELALLHELRS
jgi:hypothetical protein